jgi:ubiquinone/menaquinone biosynthesis C-methylase UbiE
LNRLDTEVSSEMRFIASAISAATLSGRTLGEMRTASVAGIDPSEAQLAFARTRAAVRGAEFRQADAMALPFPMTLSARPACHQ